MEKLQAKAIRISFLAHRAPMNKSNNELKILKLIDYFNPFLANIPISCPLKTPENLSFSHVFRGHEMETVDRNGLKFKNCLLRKAYKAQHPKLSSVILKKEKLVLIMKHLA